MKDILKKAVEEENEEYLEDFLDIRQTKKIDSSQFDMIEKSLKGTWHSQHEDLINLIYLESLKDDIFVEPILNIALNKKDFRWFDDELESTLRKCVHALKTINSTKSNEALERLKNLKNENVEITLDMYK